MKNKFVFLMAILSFFLFLGTSQVYADLIIDPDDAMLYGNSGPGVPSILDDIDNQLGLWDPSIKDFELYKSDVGTGGSITEEGDLSGSYETTYSSDYSGATIEWMEGTPYVAAPAYMLVKDGNAIPVWYFFDLTDLGWDGMETLQLTGFWPAQGSISHVSLYGNSSVPEPQTMLLLGAGLLGLAVFGRKKIKKD